MIPLEKFRRIVFGSEAAAPKAKWAEPIKETQPKGVPNPSVLLKLRGFVGIFLVANICIGGYLIAKSTPKTTKKRGQKKEAVTEATPPQVSLPSTKQQSTSHRKVTAHEQRQLFNWMLEEKRKQKPTNSVEKARIDEDKKILKQFLRATNLPPL